MSSLVWVGPLWSSIGRAFWGCQTGRVSAMAGFLVGGTVLGPYMMNWDLSMQHGCEARVLYMGNGYPG